jgi:hypothetical protein
VVGSDIDIKAAHRRRAGLARPGPLAAAVAAQALHESSVAEKAADAAVDSDAADASIATIATIAATDAIDVINFSRRAMSAVPGLRTRAAHKSGTYKALSFSINQGGILNSKKDLNFGGKLWSVMN